MPDHHIERIVSEQAERLQTKPKELAAKSRLNGAFTTPGTLEYYKDVLLGVGAETPEELRDRVGDAGMAEIQDEIRRSARRP
jgi:hypothetical protein